MMVAMRTPYPEPERDDTDDQRETWWTPHRVQVVCRLLPYYTDHAPRLRFDDSGVIHHRGWNNADEWWWQTRGDLLRAIDRIGEFGRQCIELTAFSDLSYDAAGRRLGCSASSVYRGAQQAYDDCAVILGWVRPGEAKD